MSVPSQHGKTAQIKAGVATWLRYRPQDPILYVTYNEPLAREKGREIRDLAIVAGLELRDDSRSVDTWTTPQGGGLRSRGIQGGITGAPGLQFVVVDDPFKGRRQAESAAIRRDVRQAFTANIFSRLHKRTSVIVNHTRWHEDDLIGWLRKEHGDRWEHINIPAINDAGEALCPELQPLDLLEEKRAMSEYDWWSVYMGQPRSSEGKLFSGIAYFDLAQLPSHRNVAIGVDLAYSSRKSSDWSVAVVMAESAGRYYVIDVVRRQVSAALFAAELAQLARSYPGAPMRTYASGRDWEEIETIRKLAPGVPLVGTQATTDKFIRAQPLSTAWKAGKVALLADAPWLGPYTSAMMDVSGLGDEHDDDMDATAAAYDALPHGAGGVPFEVPRSVVEARPAQRDPAITVRGRGRLGSW